MRIPVLGKTGVLWRFSLKRGPRLEGSCELRLAQQCRVPCTQELQHPLYPQAQDWASSHLPPPAPPSFPYTRDVRLLPTVVLLITVHSWGLQLVALHGEGGGGSSPTQTLPFL